MKIPVQRIDALVDEVDLEASPGGIVGVSYRGELVYSRPFGLANLEYQIPVTTETSFHIASLSKHFAAFAIALLEDRGELSFDAPIRDFFPEFPSVMHDITIRHLLHHTSGIRDQWFVLMLAGWRLDDVITTRDALRSIRNQRNLNTPPGDEYNYSNSGYTLLAEIVLRVSGRTLREFCQINMFDPLGMSSTHFHDDHTELVPGRSYSYRRGANGSNWRNAVLSYGTVGASSLHTTLGDLVRWDTNFRTGQVGGARVLELMHQHGVLNSGRRIPYCLGLVDDELRGVHRVHHAGGDAGFSSDLARFPEHELSVIALSNSAELGRAPAISEKIQHLILDELGAPDIHKGVWGETEPEAFIGQFIHEPTGLTVRIEPGTNGELQFAESDTTKTLNPDQDGVTNLGTYLDVKLSRADGEPFVETFSHADSTMRYRLVDHSREFGRRPEELVGLYFAEELQALCRIDVVDGVLSFSDRSASSSPLDRVEGPIHAVKLDHPMASWHGAITFDEDASVPAFWFSFPRAQRIRYERVEL